MRRFLQSWSPRFFLGGIVFVTAFGVLLTGQKGFSRDADRERFHQAIATLESIPLGKELLKKVIFNWNLESTSKLIENLKWGEASRTDTVLTRNYNPKTGQEERKRQITIFLRQDQPDLELLLDLAHELVHAGARPAFDPYDSNLTAGKYVWAAIEGEGGEIEAVVTECQIGLELSMKTNTSIARCSAYFQKEAAKKVKKDIVRRDFYRVGKWYADLKSKFGSELQLFPLLSAEVPKLYSSTGHSPYPVSLLKEFEEINEMACSNSLKRMRSIASHQRPNQNEPEQSKQSAELNVQQFLKKRCSQSL